MVCCRGRSSKWPLWWLPASSWQLVKESFIPPGYSSVRAFSRGATDSSSLHQQQVPPEGTFHIQKVSQCSHFYSASLIIKPKSPVFELIVAMIGYSTNYVAITCVSWVPGKQNWGLASSATYLGCSPGWEGKRVSPLANRSPERKECYEPSTATRLSITASAFAPSSITTTMNPNYDSDTSSWIVGNINWGCSSPPAILASHFTLDGPALTTLFI